LELALLYGQLSRVGPLNRLNLVFADGGFAAEDVEFYGPALITIVLNSDSPPIFQEKRIVRPGRGHPSVKKNGE
jgi:hypothetical protein